MNELRNRVFKAIKDATVEKKKICQKKGVDFSGIYFTTILEYFQIYYSNDAIHKKSLHDKIKRFLEKRKIKKALYELLKEGVIKKCHNGGITFMLKDDWNRFMDLREHC